MYAAALKERIGALPNEQFVAAWKCIEAIDAALGKAGATAQLALTYVRVLHEERLAQLLGVQQARIASMTASSVEQQGHIAFLAKGRNDAWGKITKLERKIARLKPAKKTKSKA